MKRAHEKALWFGLQLATSSRILIIEWYLQGVLTSLSVTSYQPLPRQWFDFNPVILSSLMKFAECLYCNVGPTPASPVQSYHIYSRTIIKVSYIHSLHIHIHAYTTCTQYHLYIIALITQSLVSLYPFSLVLFFSCAKQTSLQPPFNTFCAKRVACKHLWYILCQANSLQTSLIPLCQAHSLQITFQITFQLPFHYLLNYLSNTFVPG